MKERTMTTMLPAKICSEQLPAHQRDMMKLMRSHSANVNEYQKLKAAFWTTKMWPNGKVIRISFVESPGDAIQRTEYAPEDYLRLDPIHFEVLSFPIQAAIKYIVLKRLQPLVNLTFVFLADEDINGLNAEIRIGFDAQLGSYSLVGTDCLQQKTGPTMNFGWFDVATVLHEFGHALGLIHEHQNPRGQNIPWNLPRLLQWAEETQGWDSENTMHNIVNKYAVDQVNGSSFDPDSIMLYFFPGNLTLDNVGTKQNLQLSACDIAYLQNAYPRQTQTTCRDVPTNVPRADDDCHDQEKRGCFHIFRRKRARSG